MTAPNALGGLKLTEEQVACIEAEWNDLSLYHKRVIADWRTLRAERDAKDAEIARLKEMHQQAFDLAVFHQDRATRAEARLAAMASVTEAEALAIGDAALAAQCLDREGPFGLYDYTAYGCTDRPFRVRDFRKPNSVGDVVFKSNDRDEAQAESSRLQRIHIGRAALEAFVANKTAGGK